MCVRVGMPPRTCHTRTSIVSPFHSTTRITASRLGGFELWCRSIIVPHPTFRSSIKMRRPKKQTKNFVSRRDDTRHGPAVGVVEQAASAVGVSRRGPVAYTLSAPHGVQITTRQSSQVVCRPTRCADGAAQRGRRRQIGGWTHSIQTRYI